LEKELTEMVTFEGNLEGDEGVSLRDMWSKVKWR
jgi:hypothetical protein